MSAAEKTAGAAISPTRRARLAKVHIAKKQLQLDDATYGATLARLFKGITSAADLTDRQLDELLEHFKRQGFKAPKRKPRRAGNRPMADSPEAKKLRALWLSLYHLGVVRDPSETALAAYVKRTTGVAALQWLKDDKGMQAIEGLKKMAERAGVDWTKAGLGAWEPYLPAESHEPFAVVVAQWRRLLALGRTIEHPQQRCWQFAQACGLPAAPHLYKPEDWHRLMEVYGRMIRNAQRGAQ